MRYEETLELNLGKFINALKKSKEILDKFGKPYRFMIGNFTDPESGSVTWFIQFIVDHDNYKELQKLWDKLSNAFHREIGNNVSLFLEVEGCRNED